LVWSVHTLSWQEAEQNAKLAMSHIDFDEDYGHIDISEAGGADPQ
jgi:hypothetical protein